MTILSLISGIQPPFGDWGTSWLIIGFFVVAFVIVITFTDGWKRVAAVATLGGLLILLFRFIRPNDPNDPENLIRESERVVDRAAEQAKTVNDAKRRRAAKRAEIDAERAKNEPDLDRIAQLEDEITDLDALIAKQRAQSEVVRGELEEMKRRRAERYAARGAEDTLIEVVADNEPDGLAPPTPEPSPAIPAGAGVNIVVNGKRMKGDVG